MLPGELGTEARRLPVEEELDVVLHVAMHVAFAMPRHPAESEGREEIADRVGVRSRELEEREPSQAAGVGDDGGRRRRFRHENRVSKGLVHLQ